MLFAMLALMGVMTAAGVRLADRRFAGRPVVVGLFFGLLAVIANTASVLSVAEYDIALSLRDAPVIAAALFFGPLPGVLAGAIAALERALTPLWGVGSATWCPMATFLVALVAAAVRRWFLDDRRPFLVQALMLGILFEMLHLSFDVLMGIDRLERGCEIVFAAFTPEAAALASALALSSAIVGRSGEIRAFRHSRASWLLLVFLGCGFGVIGSLYFCAEYDSQRMVAGSVRRLDHLFESQIECLLHTDAAWISDKLRDPANRNLASFNRFLDDEDYDEINIADLEGRVRSSNRPEAVGFEFASHPFTRRYLTLIHGGCDYVSEPFRRSVSDAGDGPEIKYAAVPIPEVGFVQLGFLRSRFESEFKRFFFPLFNGVMNLFATDYNIIASTNDWRIAVANGGHEDAIGSLVQSVGLHPGREHARLFGEWCHIGEKQIGEWRIFCVVPLVESYGEAMVNGSVLVIILFGLVFGFRVVMLRMRRQQQKIDRLREEVDRRRRQDLEIAAKIQQSSLPVDLPSGARFSLSARMTPAKEVGGDFYDAYRLADGRLVVTIADVSGKGVPGAMFMIKAESVLKSCIRRDADLTASLSAANDRLARHNDAEMFVTVWAGIYDPETGEIDYVNAGHNPPLVRRADGSVEYLRDRGGIALAVFPGCTYKAGRLKLGPGESLILYTDGVTEAQDGSGGFYGEARLLKLLADTSGGYVERIFSDVDRFVGAAEPADDITAIVLEVKP